ncbi:hypothetical protein CVT25_003573 [Psilocybe cyanescens]|uniref:Uncharacterized protein n=1 Tax=Psilocybe cyanescens TaxID=93625 RepID=A0A409WP01_PSICY|nr:hypothetical protein CVT25_003573 [Psilocybe cyanescens]
MSNITDAVHGLLVEEDYCESPLHTRDSKATQFTVALENLGVLGRDVVATESLAGETLLERSQNLTCIRHSDTEWSSLLHFVEKHASLIRSRSHDLQVFDNKQIEDYLDTLVVAEQLPAYCSDLVPEHGLSSHASVQHEYTQEQVDQAFFFLRNLDEHEILSFREFCRRDHEKELQEMSIADQLKDLVISIAKDARECGVALRDYDAAKAKRSIYMNSASDLDYEPQISSWAIKLNSHRRRLQLSLAAYLSLGSFDGPISKHITPGFVIALGFSIFPDLDPFRENEISLRDEIHRSHSEKDLDSLCTMSAAGETISSGDIWISPTISLKSPTQTNFEPGEGPQWSHVLLGNPTALSSETDHTPSDISIYSVASSRTDDTDYGLYYRRMALSLTPDY